MKKAVFLDRDGTLNKDVDYLNSVDGLELLPTVIEGLRLLQTHGFLLIIVSNQSGVARGYFSEEELKKINNRLEEMLLDYKIKITAQYYCPHHSEHGLGKYKIACKCRKPAIGMIERAVREHFIDLSSSAIVGDKLSDVEMAEEAKIPLPILVKTGKGMLNVDKVSQIKSIRICDTFLEAAKIIVEKNNE